MSLGSVPYGRGFTPTASQLLINPGDNVDQVNRADSVGVLGVIFNGAGVTFSSSANPEHVFPGFETGLLCRTSSNTQNDFRINVPFQMGQFEQIVMKVRALNSQWATNSRMTIGTGLPGGSFNSDNILTSDTLPTARPGGNLATTDDGWVDLVFDIASDQNLPTGLFGLLTGDEIYQAINYRMFSSNLDFVIGPIYLRRRPLLLEAFIVDDAAGEQFTNLLPLIVEYGIPVTHALTATNLRLNESDTSRTSLTVAQALALLQAGGEFVVHTAVPHGEGATADPAWRDDISQNQQELEAMKSGSISPITGHDYAGFERYANQIRTDIYVLAGGQINLDDGIGILTELGIRATFSTQGNNSSPRNYWGGSPSDKYRIRRFERQTSAERETWIDQNREAWSENVIHTFHVTTTSPPINNNQMTVTETGIFFESRRAAEDAGDSQLVYASEILRSGGIELNSDEPCVVPSRKLGSIPRLSVSGNQLFINGIAVENPGSIFISPDGHLTNAPNGKPIARFKDN